MGRFTLPLCYNYLQILGESKSSLTSFIGKLNLLPVLGNGFPKIFPSIFGVLLVCKILNIHGKILSMLGLVEEKKPSSTKWNEMVQEGRKVIYKQTFLTKVSSKSNKTNGNSSTSETEDSMDYDGRNNSI